MSLEDAIAHCREVEDSPETCPSCALAHAQLAAWLDELRTRREADPAFALCEAMFGESALKCPTMREAQRIFRKNGYAMTRQKGSHQIWQKPGDPIPIVLPYHSRDNEQVRPGDWKKIVKEHRLDLDA